MEEEEEEKVEEAPKVEKAKKVAKVQEINKSKSQKEGAKSTASPFASLAAAPSDSGPSIENRRQSRAPSFFNTGPADTKTQCGVSESKTIRDLCQFSSLNF